MESITITLTPKSKQLIEQFRGVEDVMARAIANGLFLANTIALSRIQRGRFTGTGPFPVNQNRLGIVTETLRKSLRTDAPEILDSGKLQVRTAMGSAVRYFGIHEFGYSGPVAVKEHKRARGQKTHTVKAHTRTLSMPERAPLRTGLKSDEIQRIYAEKIEAALVKDLENLT